MAEMDLVDTIQKYEKAAPRFSHWMEQNVPEGLTAFSFPARHQQRILSTNMLE
jgi:transposase-like protein